MVYDKVEWAICSVGLIFHERFSHLINDELMYFTKNGLAHLQTKIFLLTPQDQRPGSRNGLCEFDLPPQTNYLIIFELINIIQIFHF